MIVFQATPTVAQWTTGVGTPPNIFYNGLTGIGPFNNVTPFTASRLLHVHSSNFLTNGGNIPAFMRLQTQIPASGEIGLNRFGETGIEFFSGSTLNGGAQWCVGKIMAITNGQGINSTGTPVFEVGTGDIDLRGGLAFYCSKSAQPGLPDETISGQNEVIRLYDQRVAINSTTAMGRLDVSTNPTGTFKTRFVFDNINGSDPVLKFYRPSGTPDPKVLITDPDVWTEFSDAYPLWMQYETAAPASLAYAQFHIKGRTTSAYPLGSETSSEMIPRFTILTGNGNVGINEPLPTTKFQVHNGAVLFDSIIGSTPQKLVGGVLTEIGQGTRLMWIPDKAAFRAGVIDGYKETSPNPPYLDSDVDPDYSSGTITMTNKTEGWNTTHIGQYSLALGRNSRAEYTNDIALGLNNVANSGSHHGAMAIGHANKATGEDAIAFGFSNRATGANSIALGFQSNANGNQSMAIGYRNNYNSSAGVNSLALGFQNEAKGNSSYAIGNECKITTGNNGSFAIGNQVTTSAIYAFGIGQNITNSESYSLLIGFSGSSDLYVERYGVAMGGTDPKNRLDVNGSVSIGYTASPSAVTNANSLSVKGKIGINTLSPSCSLGVNGTACIGWDGIGVVPTPPTSAPGDDAHPVSLIVENTVIIHGNINEGATLAPAYVYEEGTPDNYGTTDGGSYLQVWGEAIKFSADQDWDIPSDARYKKEVHSFDEGLNLLKQINPVRFKYSKELGIPGSDKKEGIGVLAQDMQKIAPYTVKENTLVKAVRTKEEKRYEVDDIDTSIIKVIEYSEEDTTHTEEHAYSHRTPSMKDSTIYTPIKRWVIEPAEYRTDSMPLLTYNPSALTYVIINSIKEIDSLRTADKQELIEKINLQSNLIHSQNSTIDSLILANKNFEERIARLETKNEISLDEVSDVILEQNNPNPFSENTTITYYIPDKVQGDAELVIAPAASQSPALQKYPLTKGTPTQLTISAQDLYTGVFVYSITVSGKVIVSKKFIIIK